MSRFRSSAVALGSLLVILLSGVYLTIQMSGSAWRGSRSRLQLSAYAPWVLRRADACVTCGAGREQHDESIKAPGPAAAPFLKISLGVRTAIFLGISY